VAKTAKNKRGLTDKARLRREIVEMTEGQHRLGLVSDVELQQVTMRMLDRDALPKLPLMSAAEIAKVRERAGVSQAVFGGFLNVETQTVSMWERGARRPTGAALKLLHVVKAKGLEVLW
jgi:putative transcriptional regulator